MKRIFTFGFDQPNFPGYVVVYGINEADCRRQMHDAYNRVWAFEYTSEDDAGVELFKLPLRATLGKPPRN